MRDVAALARVSVTTVSRVINDEPGVTAQLAVRVRAAIEQLNYRHNLTASSLRRADGRGGTIGVVLEYIADPFDSLLHRGVRLDPRCAGPCRQPGRRRSSRTGAHRGARGQEGGWTRDHARRPRPKLPLE